MSRIYAKSRGKPFAPGVDDCDAIRVEEQFPEPVERAAGVRVDDEQFFRGGDLNQAQFGAVRVLADELRVEAYERGFGEVVEAGGKLGRVRDELFGECGPLGRSAGHEWGAVCAGNESTFMVARRTRCGQVAPSREHRFLGARAPPVWHIPGRRTAQVPPVAGKQVIRSKVAQDRPRSPTGDLGPTP